jgi:hypothetical protein
MEKDKQHCLFHEEAKTEVVQEQQLRIVFEQHFWKLWKKLGYQLPEESDQNKVFMFEMLSEDFRLMIARGSESKQVILLKIILITLAR